MRDPCVSSFHPSPPCLTPGHLFSDHPQNGTKSDDEAAAMAVSYSAHHATFQASDRQHGYQRELA